MERLNLSEKPAHSLQESAIHCARYANILHLVKDKVVLDIACGEGYGSALLMKAGAKRVVGVDISEESIERAKKLFGKYDVEYIVSDANTISERYGEDFFDIVVSIETIEHINTPDVFLSSIKKTAKENAIFYITCPNDYWYYPNNEQSNPCHVRKYTFQEFKELSTGVLGNNVQWAYGGSVFGFGTVSANNRGLEKIGSSWMEISESENSINVLNTEIDAVNENNCSFFVGLWNAPETNFSNSTFPISMDAYSRMTEEFESNVREVAIKWSAAPDMTPQTVLYRRPVAQFSNFQPKIVSSWLILALFQANFLISGRSRLCPYQLVNSNQVRQGE
ncbi:class I SAM-dependent methyltransferase [Escherichia coli]